MTRQEKSQQIKEREQRIIAAIWDGAYDYAEIARVTGIEQDIVGQDLRNLAVDYKVPNFAFLKKVLTTRQASSRNYDAITIAKTMRPELSADLLVQVLGRDYCSNLIDALMVACIPPAVAEDQVTIQDMPDANGG